MVVPTHSRQLSSTNIGKSLLGKGGDIVKSKFDLLAANSSLIPGDVLEVGASASLGCSKIFCMECLAWDGVGGRGVQVRNQNPQNQDLFMERNIHGFKWLKLASFIR